MRVWHLDHGYLDKQRVKAQLQEIVALMQMVTESGRSGPAKHYALHQRYLWFKYNQVLNEYRTREMTIPNRYLDAGHDMFQLLSILPDTPYEVGDEKLRKDAHDLRSRWELEGYYFGPSRLDLSELEDRLEMRIGRKLDEVEALTPIARQFRMSHLTEYNKLEGRLRDRFQILGFKVPEREYDDGLDELTGWAQKPPPPRTMHMIDKGYYVCKEGDVKVGSIWNYAGGSYWEATFEKGTKETKYWNTYRDARWWLMQHA